MSQDSQHSSDKEKAFNLYNTGELAHARVLCQSLCGNNPQDAEIWCLLSAINGTLGLIDEAEQCGRRAVSLAPDYTLARFNLAVAMMRLNDTDKAIAEFRQVIRQQPNHGMAYFLLGTCYDQQAGKVGEALACHEKACQLMGNPPKDLLTGLADLYERTGDIDRARQLVDKLLQSVPGDPKAGLIMARLEKRDGQLAAARSRLEQILKGEISPADRLRILGQLGHVLDQLGDYERAYDVFKKTQWLAGEVSPEQYKTGVWYDRIHRNRAVTCPENISTWSKNPARDGLQAPVFLVGFPRSGTTLTEQIITSHPGVVSSDERSLVHGLLPKLTTLSANQLGYPYNLNDLTEDQVTVLRREYWLLAHYECGAEPAGKLFLDKLPLNIIELCLINRIFPEARILLLLRDPRDVCLSCFMQLFRPNDAMANFSDLESTARFYDATMGLWRHYEQVLDLNLFKLRYEDLVSDFEPRMREMLTFLGLGWDDRVLEYYKNRKQGISTPSYQDTSKPIYSRAAGRWLNYKKHMEPLMTILQPYIVSFGYE